MSELYLNCYTVDNVSPINKKHVFLSYHKGDFNLMLKQAYHLGEMLDCAVYYLNYVEFPYPDVDELCSLIKGMDLFVPIVTKLYLDECGDYDEHGEVIFDLLNYIFRFAEETCLPIMPLVFEEGLEKDFNRICGKIHFLQDGIDKNQYTSLDEKIINFYNELFEPQDKGLVELKPLVNKIFISYRRKDKKDVRKLIDLIQCSDELFDVGLWYDEFLTTGQKYDYEITSKIDNSTMMIIFITDIQPWHTPFPIWNQSMFHVQF